jgi:hypothetical protein
LQTLCKQAKFHNSPSVLRCLLLQVDIRCGTPPTDEEFVALGWPIKGATTTTSSGSTALPVPTTLVGEAAAAASPTTTTQVGEAAAAASPTTTTTLIDEAAAASPNTTSSSCVYDMYPSSRCCSDSAADVICRIQVASAATAKTAAAKSKLPLLQTAECDTAAAMVDLADNMQQQTKQQHSVPAAAAVLVVRGSGKVGSKKSCWVRHVCSLLVVCVAGSSLRRKVAAF